MNDTEKVNKITEMFKELLGNHEMENLTAVLGRDGLTCVQARTERTILNLGTFAIRVQDALGL